jgi:hypothetical protein
MQVMMFCLRLDLTGFVLAGMEHYRKNFPKNLHPTCNPILKFGILWAYMSPDMVFA